MCGNAVSTFHFRLPETHRKRNTVQKLLSKRCAKRRQTNSWKRPIGLVALNSSTTTSHNDPCLTRQLAYESGVHDRRWDAKKRYMFSAKRYLKHQSLCIYRNIIKNPKKIQSLRNLNSCQIKKRTSSWRIADQNTRATRSYVSGEMVLQLVFTELHISRSKNRTSSIHRRC